MKKKIAQEARYDGFYAVCTDLFEDSPEDILKVSEGRWQIEACFRIMKTDFAARPVYLHWSEKNSCPFSHLFLIIVGLPLIGKNLNRNYTCEDILHTLQNFEFARCTGPRVYAYLRINQTD